MRMANHIARLAGIAALGLVFTASDCSHTLSFTPPLNREICDDGIDNDGNGRVDCRDAECLLQCRPELTVDPIAVPVRQDSLELSGNAARAASVTVTASPSGIGGQAQISGLRWTFLLRNLKNGEHTLVAVAVDSTGHLRDTVTAAFEVQLRDTVTAAFEVRR